MIIAQCSQYQHTPQTLCCRHRRPRPARPHRCRHPFGGTSAENPAGLGSCRTRMRRVQRTVCLRHLRDRARLGVHGNHSQALHSEGPSALPLGCQHRQWQCDVLRIIGQTVDLLQSRVSPTQQRYSVHQLLSSRSPPAPAHAAETSVAGSPLSADQVHHQQCASQCATRSTRPVVFDSELLQQGTLALDLVRSGAEAAESESMRSACDAVCGL